MTKSANKFSLLGPGKVGSSLACALSESGWRCVEILGGSGAADQVRTIRKHFPHSRFSQSILRVDEDFDVLFISVSDDSIPEVARRLSANEDIRWSGKRVFHMSGVVPVSVLGKLREAGASVGALHPIAAFAARFSPASARNVYYDFLGDRAALNTARHVVRSLSSNLVVLAEEEERVRLHIASVMVSNFTVISSMVARELVAGYLKDSLAKDLIDGLLSSTLGNISSMTGVSSLTGPLVRGDVEVIQSHMKALESNKALLQFYTSASLLGVEALMRVEQDPVKKRNLAKIMTLLEG